MTQLGSVASGLIKDGQVTFVGGKIYSDIFQNQKKGGFRIASKVNSVGGDDLECTYTLESWDGELNEWVPEPRAIFDAHPAGVAILTVDTFPDTQAEKYKVGIEPTAGVTGYVKMSFSMQNKQ